MSRTTGNIEPGRYVVKIFGKTEDGQNYNGTGFLLNPAGYVATCWHVVEKAAEVFVQLPYEPKWIYEVCDKREQDDVAVLQPIVAPGVVTVHATLHLDWFETDKIKSNVEVWGYSNPNVDVALQYKCSISGVTNQYGLIMLDGHINEGDSGGPVINDAGHVIGITNYKDTKRQGQAMARPISRLHKILTEKKIQFGAKVGSGNFAEAALNSLLGLMEDPQVREAVKLYGSIFGKSSSQISTLHAYKKVHDLLYNVEFVCFNSIAIDARDFPDQESAREKMSIHLSQLRKHVSDADDIVSEDVERRERIIKVRDQLKEARDALQDAELHQDVAHCHRALKFLRILLASRAQSNFNLFLNEAAKVLNMQGLVEAMQSVQKVISKANVPEGTAEEFQLGVDDLAELGGDLQARTKEHDDWQQLDDVLRVINRNSPDLLSDMEVYLPLLMSELGSVCDLTPAAAGSAVAARSGSNWTTNIVQETTSLQEALNSRDLTRTRRHFGSLHQHAAERFDRVDKKLLKVCGKISKVKDPLRTLVEKLG
jgi:Trypsin-like peptidase domain